MKNKVQLIIYANRFCGVTLAEVHDLYTGLFAGVFCGVHILPFFLPIDGADAGFDPIDHTVVDPKVVGCNDIKAIARDFSAMADVIVNHISTDSSQFRDYLHRGDASPYRWLFLGRDNVFPSGVSPSALAAIYHPRSDLSFTTMRLDSGEARELWMTFTHKQIDINVIDPKGRAYLDYAAYAKYVMEVSQ